MIQLGIIGAMEIEISKIRAKMQNESENIIAGMCFTMDIYNGVQIVVVKSGIGKVNAAACMQILASEYSVCTVINIGVAGGIGKGIRLGDIVVGNSVRYHDFDATGLGYELGEIPEMKDSIFEADTGLVQIIELLASNISRDINIHIGTIVSGDQFVSADSDKKRLKENFQALCTEMEGAAIAHVAHLNKIPFIIVRAISDMADDEASDFYDDFSKRAADNSIFIVDELLRVMKKGKKYE